jgi:hypothetical protein
MSKSTHAKIPTRPVRSPKDRQILGFKKDGITIARPPFAPSSFTVRELEKAVRGLKRDKANAEAG